MKTINVKGIKNEEIQMTTSIKIIAVMITIKIMIIKIYNRIKL